MKNGLNHIKENPNGETLAEGWQTLVPKDIKLFYQKEDTAKDNPSFIIDFLNTQTQVTHAEWLRTDGSQNWKWISFANIFGFEPFEDGTPDEEVLNMLKEKMMGEPLDVQVKKNPGQKRDGTQAVFTNIVAFAESGTKAEEEEKIPVNHAEPEPAPAPEKKTIW